MSYSISLIGSPDKIAEALNNKSVEFQGQTKIEFDEILPHLVGLLNQNASSFKMLMKLEASGHAYTDNDGKLYKSCQVSINFIHGEIIE